MSMRLGLLFALVAFVSAGCGAKSSAMTEKVDHMSPHEALSLQVKTIASNIQIATAAEPPQKKEGDVTVLAIQTGSFDASMPYPSAENSAERLANALEEAAMHRLKVHHASVENAFGGTVRVFMHDGHVTLAYTKVPKGVCAGIPHLVCR
ncbi:MAG: hypothetical protein M0T84_02925 [Betaproteobacteria bacterium]|nr:hypothetical protein [Betaproteobacteria bacterium]